MKQLATIAAILTLTACGGSDNPLAVVQDDQAQVDQDSETIDSSPALVPNMAITTPVVNQEPVQQPVQEQNNPVPVAGECIDTDPVNDGWGFNGATSCQLPIEPVVTPDCVGEGYGYGWENDASCVYVNQPVEVEPVNPPVILPEPVVPEIEEVNVPTQIDDVFGRLLDCVIFGEDTMVPHTLLFRESNTVIRSDNLTGVTSETTWIRNGDGIKLQNGLPLNFIDGKLTSGNFNGWEYTCSPE